jgi:hypothetical protein
LLKWEADLEALDVERDIGSKCKIVYKRFRSPTPISDREVGFFLFSCCCCCCCCCFFFFFEKQVGQFVSVIGLKKLENGGQLFVDRSIKFPSRPVHGGCVRGSIVLSATLIEPTKKDGMFLVTFLSWLDMKGMLPAAMISMYRHKTAERIDLLRFVFSGKTLDDDSD